MPAAQPAASIIVPAFREAANLAQLTERVFSALGQAGIEAELIIVDDDSQDGTVEIVDGLKGRWPVRLIVRTHERGLSSAVLAGLEEAKSDRFVVMDADLQHPPESVPDLLRELDRDGCDFVIGTRYAATGAIDEDWPLFRRVVSRVATLMARPLVPLSDPMSGFFALRRETLRQAAPLDPIGYKIALELYVKGRCRRPAEVPIRFAARAAGTTKLTFGEQVRYLRHLWRLYRFRFPHASHVIWMAPAAMIGIATWWVISAAVS
ncbi:MAG: polyprenol monophosphomannose synthase [Planctomycetes bacterium]|nr:polyprenol monophosphomannose synthase [Planctomycetota bacterium]